MGDGCPELLTLVNSTELAQPRAGRCELLKRSLRSRRDIFGIDGRRQKSRSIGQIEHKRTQTMKNKTIGVIASTAALGAAMCTQLASAFPNAEIKVIDRISDRTPGSELATLGLPSYVPGQDAVTIHNFGTKMLNDATTADRRHQWEVVRAETSTEEEVLEQLGGFQTQIIEKEYTVKERKMQVAELKIAASEAETDEELNEVYKNAFDLLKELV